MSDIDSAEFLADLYGDQGTQADSVANQAAQEFADNPDYEQQAEQAISDAGIASGATSESSSASKASSASESDDETSPVEPTSSDTQSSSDDKSNEAESSTETSEPNSSADSSNTDSVSSSSESKTASSAVSASKENSLEEKSASINSKKAKDFMASHDLSGTDDPPVIWLMNKAIIAIKDYVEVAKSNYKSGKKLDEDTFNAQMRRLQQLPKSMSEALVGVWSEYNKSTLRLKKQVDDLEQQHEVESQYNPSKETHLLVRWVKTGIPTRMEKDFYRLDKVANDPRFQPFLQKFNLSENVPVPKAVSVKRRSLHEENKAHEASSASTSNVKKGGQSNGNQ